MKFDASDQSTSALWGYYNTGNTNGYIMAAIGSDGTKGALNTCGLRNQGSYVVLATFQITWSGIVENLMLMRDPSGESGYTGNWNKDDNTRWTTANKAKIPFNLDVTL
jgi:hypothetical protein